ncbi:MAG: hypothetical protein OEY96_11645 [Gammaproteobacteria bacterium]|nr:hypothetical protein [Gammaproteobacteria bacterium]
MIRYKNIAINLILVVTAFAGGVYYGFNEGVENFYNLEKVLSSNRDVLRAKELKNGTDKDLKHIYWHFELSINDGIDAYNWYQNSGNHIFSEIFLSEHLQYLERSMNNLAKYRNSHHFDEEINKMMCRLPESEEDKADCMQRIEERIKTIEKYSVTP